MHEPRTGPVSKPVAALMSVLSILSDFNVDSDVPARLLLFYLLVFIIILFVSKLKNIVW